MGVFGIDDIFRCLMYLQAGVNEVGDFQINSCRLVFETVK